MNCKGLKIDIQSREHFENYIFVASGQKLNENRLPIAGLQEGELIINGQLAFALGMGKKYKKINVIHMI